MIADEWETLAQEVFDSQQQQPDNPEEPSSWQPVNLKPVLDGNWQRPQPTVGKRSDGVGLFYPAKTHTMIGETEAGKGWAVLSAVLDEMAAGNHVVYIDFEDDEGTITDRLRTLGAKPDTIIKQFHYIKPEHPLQGRHLTAILEVLRTYQPTLVVVDGVTEAMNMHGLNPLDNVDISTFDKTVARRLISTGAAQVSLDHVVKNGDNRGRYAIGGVHKLNIVSGAGYTLENRTPFGIEVTGRSTLKIAKDRPAQLRVNGLPSSGGMHWYGDLVLASHDDNHAEVSIEPPHEKDENFRPTKYMARISEAMTNYGKPMSGKMIELAVTGKAETIRQALGFLTLDGYVTEKTPHSLIKPYTAP